MKKKIKIPLIICIAALICIGGYALFHYQHTSSERLPDKYNAVIEQVHSTVDQDGDGIDDQFGFEFFDFLQCGETIRVIHETQLVRVDVKHGRLVLKTQYIRKEGTHFTGSED